MQVSSNYIAQKLEAHGWLKSIAGDDFETACKAIQAMFGKGRGILIAGDAGCGKTHLMRAIRKMLSRGNGTWLYSKEKEDLAYMHNSDDVLVENVFMDDIGAEDDFREYGKVVDVVGDFVQKYHYRGKGRFIATTNLNSQQITDKYGMRCLDRLMEMCVVFKMKGKSKRERVIF